MNTKLSPCPYCHGKNTDMACHLLGFHVTCRTCLASGPSKASRREAATMWNKLFVDTQRSRHWHATRFSSQLKALEEKLKDSSALSAL